MKNKLSVIIPMYNEEKNVPKAIESLKAFADKYTEDFNFEIIMVNDGSSDHTQEEAEKLAATDERFVITGYEKNKGKGGAVRTGILSSTGDYCVYTDCDLAYGTDAIAGIVKKAISDKSDICIGSRNISKEGYEGYTVARKIISKSYIKLVSVASGFKHSDSQCGIKCYRGDCAREVFAKCTVDGFAFDLEALMIAEKSGYTVTEFPVKIINHNQSESKVNTLKEPFKMIGDIRKMKKKIKKQR